MTISKCSFDGNYAGLPTSGSTIKTFGGGGALYYTCDATIKNCNLKISNGTSFTNNQADILGGAIYWDELEPDFSEDTLYSGNSAK